MQPTTTTILKAGVLHKKGSGAGLFGRRNWKPRYFELTATHLSYYDFASRQLKGVVSLDAIGVDAIECMPEDAIKTGSSGSTIYRIGVTTPTRRLLLSAANENEMYDWIDALVEVVAANAKTKALAKIVLGSDGKASTEHSLASKAAHGVSLAPLTRLPSTLKA
ncbi:hypothetical protein SPRG_12224 [Saprolegnia parasitica CBS 223.65]|uniref:PH domain-containing protein n=1 Tax=Saprolegnia parasitica (strain CBS 223.65) TaxID=695850 RepID=A0A067BYT0_SAPPC|nr:hypothetical protein SPRG_12224 [Saprolegnia parasitica CBS 223.65]KDO22015.1 hypothetical protein SPRG_12224 [Saprolegnia parasitica CBS 223.65]|eukprot:XP_012207259.1 hypothetical protein SPRG_12224 [Saprolegnia parasitica CBS 223.65]